MLTKLITFALLVFTLGWLSHSFYSGIALAEATPATDLVPAVTAYAEPQPVILEAKKTENKAQQPQTVEREREWVKLPDFLSPGDIHVTSNRIVIDGIPGYEYETAIFTNTDSMLPVLDENCQAIQIRLKTPEDVRKIVKPGVIISYDPPDHLAPPGIFIHRVTWVGHDTNGNWAAKAKGDNNPFEDPILITENMVKRATLGVFC